MNNFKGTLQNYVRKILEFYFQKSPHLIILKILGFMVWKIRMFLQNNLIPNVFCQLSACSKTVLIHMHYSQMSVTAGNLFWRLLRKYLVGWMLLLLCFLHQGSKESIFCSKIHFFDKVIRLPNFIFSLGQLVQAGICFSP